MSGSFDGTAMRTECAHAWPRCIGNGQSFGACFSRIITEGEGDM